jgi:hypothetical protein
MEKQAKRVSAELALSLQGIYGNPFEKIFLKANATFRGFLLLRVYDLLSSASPFSEAPRRLFLGTAPDSPS